MREALATIVQQTSAEPPVYLVELLFSFKGIKRVDVPQERIRPQYQSTSGKAAA